MTDLNAVPGAFRGLAAIDVAALKARIGGRLVVASVSGGKDSAAMSLLLTELGIEHLRVFADTGWEADATYEYLRGPLTAKLGPIHEVRSLSGGMEEIATKKAMFASRVRRWCTEELKIFPLRDYMQWLLDHGRAFYGIVNCVGIRAAESEARSKFSEWEPYPPGLPAEVETWRPLLRWTEQDVIDMHKRHGLPPNPLYLKGANRVGCWPCIFSRKEEIALVSRIDPARIDRIRDLERRVGDASEARYAAKGETLEQHGYSRPTFFTKSTRDENGKRPMSPIDDVVAWATKPKGDGKQLPMFEEAPDDALEGCMRWGVCETHETDAKEPS